MDLLQPVIERVCKTEYGFKDIEAAANELFDEHPRQALLDMVEVLLAHEERQPRCLATFLLGRLAATSPESLQVLRKDVSQDPDWRVQEILAKAFDRYCADTGYEAALPTIKDWLADPSPNVRRAVTEGLRIWTGRPYFKDRPSEAIQMLSELRAHESEYLRKSVGNALHDIGKRHAELLRAELAQWDMSDDRVTLTHRLANRTL